MWSENLASKEKLLNEKLMEKWIQLEISSDLLDCKSLKWIWTTNHSEVILQCTVQKYTGEKISSDFHFQINPDSWVVIDD